MRDELCIRFRLLNDCQCNLGGLRAGRMLRRDDEIGNWIEHPYLIDEPFLEGRVLYQRKGINPDLMMTRSTVVSNRPMELYQVSICIPL